MTLIDFLRLIPVGLLVPLLGRAIWKISQLQRGRRILGFARRGNLDVVLTTSLVAEPDHGVPARRPLTGYGQVRGVTSCAKAIARLYPRKLLSLHLSGYVRGPLESDLLLLGGPLKNEETERFLARFRKQYQLSEFSFDDLERSIRVSVTNQHFAVKNYEPRPGKAGFPAEDIGIIILSRRIGARGQEFRTILCAGLTTYGTAAAADFVFGTLVNMSRRRARKLAGIRMFSGPHDMIIMVQAELSGYEVTDVQATRHFRLRRAKEVKPDKALEPA